ncbi:MAG: regulatory protein RecX [Bacteroidota bacterium]
MAENNSPDFKDALRRAAALCSRQEQCSGHIREKLRSWNVEPDMADRVILKLHEEKFLDDRRYARFYVRDKFRLNRWGKIKITAMLRQKGIQEAIIQDSLSQINEEDYYQTCADLIHTKSATLHEKNQFTRKGKLFRFATSRGFESDLIHRILS